MYTNICVLVSLQSLLVFYSCILQKSVLAILQNDCAHFLYCPTILKKKKKKKKKPGALLVSSYLLATRGQKPSYYQTRQGKASHLYSAWNLLAKSKSNSTDTKRSKHLTKASASFRSSNQKYVRSHSVSWRLRNQALLAALSRANDQ